MFRRLSTLYDEVAIHFEKRTQAPAGHTKIVFTPPEFKSKVFVTDGLIYLQIPESADAVVEFSKYLRVKKIYDFLKRNWIRSDFSEANVKFFEEFIKVYNRNEGFKGTAIDRIRFENVLYPVAAVEEKSRFKIVLPLGSGNLYWEKVLAEFPESAIRAGKLKNLALKLSKSSQESDEAIYRVLSINRDLFLKQEISNSLEGAKMRNRLVKLLSREFLPGVRSRDVVRAIENIPYRSGAVKEISKKLLEAFRSEGGLPLKEIQAVFLTPLRAATLRKMIAMLTENRDLRNLKISVVRFDSSVAKPRVKYDSRRKSFVLTMSDFATRNNIYAALKKVSLR